MAQFPVTARNQVRRLPKRGVYDRETVHGILDAGFLCHVGFEADGQVFVIPTLFARSEDTIYLHGSAASRMLRTTSSETRDICITVTLVDAIVLARSSFHHSMNYRSAVVFGKPSLVTEREEKLKALQLFTDKIVRNRWEEARQPNESELKATNVLNVPIEEASAKIRTGPPIDDDEDYNLPIWAGIVPVALTVGEPKDDGRVLPGVPAIDLARLAR